LIHEKWENGNKFWYDAAGRWVHIRVVGGLEVWKNNNGGWVDKKPKNWKYENV